MATKTWQGGNDNWTTATDWSPTGAPAAGDDVSINQGDPQIESDVGMIGTLSVTTELDFQSGGALDVTGAAINSGTIDVAAGGFYGGTSFTVGGLLTNSGTLNFGNSGESGAVTVTFGSLQNFVGATTGTINLTGNTSFETEMVVQSAAGFGTLGSETGTVNLSSDAQIQFASGQINSVRGTLTLSGADAVISNDGTDTNSALTGLTAVSGTLDIYNDVSITPTGNVMNTGTIGVDPGGFAGGSTLHIGGKLTNPGTLNLGNGGLSANSTLSVGSLQNFSGATLGTINVSGGALNTSNNTSFEALLNVGTAAGFGVMGSVVGTVNLYQDAQIQFTGGEIGTIAGALTLNGADAAISNDGTDTNSALAGLTTVSGTLDTYNGVAIRPTGSVTNTGTIGIDPGGFAGGSSLEITGGLTNSGTLNVGNGGLSATTTVTAANLTNVVGSTDGTINVSGNTVNQQTGVGNQALLNIGSGAGFGTTGSLIGSVNLYQDAQIEFASGQINTITSGSELTLNGLNATISNDGSDTNSALTGLTTVNGQLFLYNDSAVAPTGDVTNTGTIGVDQGGFAGGSSLDISESLTNSGTLNVGNGGLSDNTTVSAASLTNFAGSTDGTINVSGNLPNTQTGIANVATLDVGAPAGFGTTGSLVGSVNLYQDGQIQFTGGQITTITSGSELTLNGVNAAIANDGSDTNSALEGLATVAGTLTMSNGAIVTTGGAAGVANTLTIGNTLTDTGYINTPDLDIAAGGTFDIGAGGSLVQSTAITFTATSGTATLALEPTPSSGSTFGNALADFGTDDALDLKGLTFAAGATATYAGGMLTVTSDGVSENFTLDAPTATTFYTHQDSGTGTLVTTSPTVCFASGTRIRTVCGQMIEDIAVEDLRAGDLAITASGAARPIRWLGHRVVRPRSHPRPHEVQPIRIIAHALGPDQPSRDLFVSPGHAICVDVLGEVLIPALALVDGAAIAQLDSDTVTYWHVELDSHDILLADNLACESYLEMGNRSFFAETGVVALGATPDGPAATHADFCRPFHAAGLLVDAIRARLAGGARTARARRAA